MDNPEDLDRFFRVAKAKDVGVIAMKANRVLPWSRPRTVDPGQAAARMRRLSSSQAR